MPHSSPSRNKNKNRFQQPKVRPDGKPPRVKSDQGLRPGNNNAANSFPRQQGNKQGNRVEFDQNEVRFVPPEEQQLSLNEINAFNSGQGNAAGFDFNNGPEVRPDGRKPRVKSDILQGNRNGSMSREQKSIDQ